MPQVDINQDLWDVLEARAEEKGFDGTESYVRDILQQVVERIREEKEGGQLSSEQEKKVKERLKGLGYLD